MPNIPFLNPDHVGLLGISLILGMYCLLQLGKLQSTDFWYSMGNLLGSVFLLFSLFYNWNMSAVVLQCAWIGISVYGLIKARRLKHA